MKGTILAVIIGVMAVIGIYCVGFLVTAGLTYLVCLGFGIEWSWLLALGVYAACLLIRWLLSAINSGGSK